MNSITSRPIAIQFGLLTSEQIIKYAVCEVANPKIRGDNLEETLYDPRMGTMEKQSCITCGLSYTNCPGHFGYMKLPEPIFNIGHINTVYKLAYCICLNC